MYKFIGLHNKYYELDIYNTYYKFNSNCPTEEKGGKTGPGSCGGLSSNGSKSDNTTKDISISSNDVKLNLMISNKAIKSLPKDYSNSLSTYISVSSNITKELIAHPNSNRKIIDINKVHTEAYDQMKKSGKSFFNDYDMKGQAKEKLYKELDISDPYVNNHIAKIDAIMSKSKLSSPLVVYSGTTPSFFNNLPQEVGSEFKLCTFISTSINPKVADGFATHAATVGRSGIRAKSGDIPSILEIRLPKNARALLLEDFVKENFPSNTKWMIGGSGKKNTTGNQKEVLLDRNISYRVIGKEFSNNKRKLILEVELNE